VLVSLDRGSVSSAIPPVDAEAARIRILTFTRLFPNREEPRLGIFVETRLRAILGAGDVDARVVAPVPWFPFGGTRWARYGRLARLPREEMRHGTLVYHPRYVSVPGASMFTAPFAIAHGARTTVDAIRASGFDFDAIDAHYFYPDGVAATMLARRLGKPVQITARGTDINVLSHSALPRRMIRWAIRHADALVAVSAALKYRLVELGADESRVHVLRNGVDCGLFRPTPRSAAREALAVRARVLIASVGNLVPEKGHDLVIDVLEELRDAELVIVGDGPERAKLEQQARRRGLENRVRFLPVRPQSELATVYSAADVLVLASSREGWPNVVLEAMACGTPVVATNVGGVPEIIGWSESGVLVEQRTAAAIAAAIRDLLARCPDREATRAYAQRFGWDETATEQRRLFGQMVYGNRKATNVQPRDQRAPMSSVRR
jgi:glycosyltransferase involved in cell wall biosynthesis